MLKVGEVKGKWKSIVSYFRYQVTNAIAEGLNSKITVIQKMANGRRNREHFKIAIYFNCRNLNMGVLIFNQK